MSTSIMDFKRHLTGKRRLSGKTAEAYGKDIVGFAWFLLERQGNGSRDSSACNNALKAAGAGDVRAFMEHLEGKGHSARTRYCKLSALRGFYRFLVRSGRIASNPAEAVRMKRPESGAPRFLLYEDVKRLIEAPPMDTRLGARDRAILETLYSTGIRVSELLALNMGDIDFLGEVVHIRAKGKKERIAPIGSSALQVIQHYMECRNKKAQRDKGFECEALFLNRSGGRLSVKGVWRTVNRYARETGLGAAVSPKWLRHSFAAHMLANGADLGSVQELLGHSKLEITRSMYAEL